MNLMPDMSSPTRSRHRRVWLLAVLLGMSCGCQAPPAAAADRVYRLEFRITPDPAARGARVELRLRQPGYYLREIDMSTLGGRLSDFSGDGKLTRAGDRITWLPPQDGGNLRWFARLEHRRGGGAYDAYIEPQWALFRGEDIIPSATTRTLKDASSDTRLRFDLPDHWSIVTPYRAVDGDFAIDNPERRFDTPTGWIVAGDLGVRIETIENVRVIVAGPVGYSIRRMDLLALLRWTLPDLVRILPNFPDRLTIVSAGDPMWRGALSAPRSVYLHAERPLISGNATSTLVHEAVHVGLALSDADGADWIVEGLAEYYSLELLRRSGTISSERFRTAHRDLAAWARDADVLCGAHSNGSTTALAVTVMVELDAEIRAATGGRSGLDDVMAALSGHDGKISVPGFRDVATKIAGKPLKTLQDKRLPGCRANGA